MAEATKFERARTLIRRALRPTSRLGKTALWFGIVATVLQVWKFIARSGSGTTLSMWATLCTYLFVFFLLLRWVRYARQALLWRLRNRLIVTYVFIGVIPIILLIAMVLLAGYLFAGQFATYVALSDLDIELQHLVTANNALAHQIRNLARQNKLTPELAAEIANASNEGFRQRTVTVLEGDRGFVIEPGNRTVDIRATLPTTAQKDLSNFVVDSGRLHMRAVKHVEANSLPITVISNVPVTSDLLQRAARVGSVELYPPASTAENPASPSGSTSSSSQSEREREKANRVTIDLGGSKSTVDIAGKAVTSVEAGKVQPAATSFDPEFRWWTLFSALIGKPART